MQLNDHQKDSITELINIAFSRAAAALSDLTGKRILLDVPQVLIRSIHELGKTLTDFIPGEIATVHQIFSGPVSGDAMLLLNYEGGVMLSNLLTGETLKRDRLFQSDREVLTEVGNILLNACLGTFGNILKVQVTFSVPRLHLDSLEGLIDSLVVGKEEILYALIAHTRFYLKESAVNGFLVIVLGVSSLDLFLQAVEALG